jgi:hypothetical protein
MPPTTGNQPPVPPPPQQPPAYQPPPEAGAAPPPAKKKMGPLAWVLIGCLGLFVLGGILFAALGYFAFNKAKDVVGEFAENPVRESVELMVRANPDLELVSTDDQAETMTIRNTETGEVATFDWSDIQNGEFRWEADGQEYTVDASEAAEGRFEVRDESGQGVFALGSGDVPEWFPEYPGAIEVNVLVSATQNGQDSTIWTFQSSDKVAEVLGFYEQRLEADGWEVTKNVTSAGGVDQGSVDGKRDNGARSVNLVASTTQPSVTQVMVTYVATSGG